MADDSCSCLVISSPGRLRRRATSLKRATTAHTLITPVLVLASVYCGLLIALGWQGATYNIYPPAETYPWHLRDYRALHP